jgi:hypothetical protein
VNNFAPLPARLWQRTDVRLAPIGLAGLLAVYLGFIGMSVPAAEIFIKRGGYYVMLLTFALFLHALWSLRRARAAGTAGDEVMSRRQIVAVVLAIGGLSLLAINSEPFRSKILNDEFVLQSTAFNLHYFRDVTMMVRGYDIQGVFLSTDGYLDKRPILYPFLVSLVHDFTGYRLLNAYLLNAVLMPVALWLVFIFGRQLTGWRGGLLAVVLLGSLPLLGQNATGSGMELLNVVMILTGMVLATEYLRAPREEPLVALGLAAVLLAQARYESALYVAPVAIVVLAGWLRAGRMIVPGHLLVVPLLLIPCALQNKVLSNSPLMWELTDKATTRFSFDYFANNALGAVQFLFSRSVELANSQLLSAVGVIGLGWVLWRLVRTLPAWRTGAAAGVTFAVFGLAIVANTLLVFCYYWSNFSDRMAARFSLPLHVLLAFSAVLLMARLDRWWPATRILTWTGLVFFLGFSTSRYAGHGYSHVGIDEVEWERRFVNALPPGERIIISNKSTLPWLLEKKPSILIPRARFVADRLAYQLHQANFREILVLQGARPTTFGGDFEIPPDERLPAWFKTELIVEKRFGSKLARISRLVSVDLPADFVAPSTTPTPASKPVGGRSGPVD